MSKMVWDPEHVAPFLTLAGCFSLPGKCWAVLQINHSPSEDAAASPAVPEGYDYKWVVLAPGEPPGLRGHRMAGVDNSDDSDVRNQIKAHPKQGAHRAHRHYPNWKEIKVIRGQDWPIAAKGIHLTAPPATPEDFWALCMACLNDTLTELGLEMPTEPDLWENHISEKDFREMQRILRQGPESEPAL